MTRKCVFCGTQNRVPAEHLADTGKCGSCKRPLPPVEEPLEVATEQFDEIVRSATVPVLVDFWAVWCGPCRQTAPDVERTAVEMAGRAIVLKVDVDQVPELAMRYNVRGIPTFFVFRDGKLVHQAAGVVNLATMKDWLAHPTSGSAERM